MFSIYRESGICRRSPTECFRYKGQATGDPDSPFTEDPVEWKVAEGLWRSRTAVTYQFICTLSGEVLASAAPRCDNVQQRGVALPEALVTSRRLQWCEARAMETTQTGKCLLLLDGYDGQEEGEPLTLKSKVRYEWAHVQTPEGQRYVVKIRYEDMNIYARPVPHSPMKLQGACGFRFSVAFFDTLAENMCTGLTYQGVIYDGPALQMPERAVPQDAANPLDAKAYWLLPQGTLRCTSARELHQGSAAALAAAPRDTKEEYIEVASAFGYLYLGGRCSCTERCVCIKQLLEERGTIVDKRWEAVRWQLPESALQKCWWLTNPPEDSSVEAAPQFLCKSIAILRAEQHRLRIASLGKLREELQRRQERNRQARARLGENAEWNRLAKESQGAWTRRPTSSNLAALTLSTYQLQHVVP